jgi:tetratricopeptide (TPR) repeat protein/tRNA A-37 threonylcarbamoyl transferase component Bud32
MKCPRCQADNPDTKQFCSDCGTKLPTAHDAPPAMTETLQTPLGELTTGSTFAGRYQVIEELGHGGMGRVYKVFDTEIKEKIALKLLRPEIAVDKGTIERFSDELKLARKISHRNVCRMFDLGRAEGTTFISMEYVPGEDLKKFIRKSGQLGAGRAVSIARQICEGLAEAHRLGVIHRDLKPQNIMVDEDGNARIMDFGIARSIGNRGRTGAGVMIGTPEYMSPEQVEGTGADRRSDVYSLGVILYEMLTGRVPFEGDTPFVIGVKHKSEPPRDPHDLNPGIPPDLGRLVLRCLEKDREKRYSSAEELCYDLGRIEQGLPTTERAAAKRAPLTSREITVKIGLKKLLGPAVATAALIIAALAVWKLALKGPLPLGPGQKRSVAVVSFENLTGDPGLDDLRKAIPNLLITSLEQTGHFDVATWERMRDILRQMGQGDADIIGRDAGFALCRQDGIEAIVLGTFTRAGNMFATDVKVLDVRTKALLKSASSRGEGVDSILKTQIDALSREVSAGLGPGSGKAVAAAPVAEVTTASMDAYHYYLRGNEEIERYDYPEALDSFKKAVAIDPGFAAAYQCLARAHDLMFESRAAGEALEKAMTLAGKATEKERLYIEADHAAFIEKDEPKSIRLFKQLIDRYPKEKKARLALANTYGYDDAGKAIAELNEALAIDPGYAEAYQSLGLYYRYRGDFDKALEVFDKYSAVSPDQSSPLDNLANLHFREGRLDEAVAGFQKALSIRPTFIWSTMALHYISALNQDYSEAFRLLDRLIAEMQGAGGAFFAGLPKAFLWAWLGSLNRASDELAAIIDQADKLGNEEISAIAYEIKAWAYFDRGEFERSRDFFERVESYYAQYYSKYIYSMPISYTSKALVCFYHGLLDLKLGRTESAKARLEELRSVLPPSRRDQCYEGSLLEAEILLAEGRSREAILLLEKTPPRVLISLSWGPYMIFYNFPFLKDTLARAYAQNGEIDKAIAEYERLTSVYPKSGAPFLIHPKYYCRLARLYENKGMKAKARENLERFLGLWKDADPGLPEIEDAKTRVASLK